MVTFAQQNSEALVKPTPRARAQDRRRSSTASKRLNSPARTNLRRSIYESRARLGSCSRDPIGHEGGENLYRYCSNRPNVYVDPDGQIPIMPIVTWVGRAMRAMLVRLGIASASAAAGYVYATHQDVQLIFSELNWGRERGPEPIWQHIQIIEGLGDVDGDGDLDIVVSNDKPDEKVIYKNDGRGNFSVAGTWGEPSWNTRNILPADINQDHYLDLIVANRKSRSYIIMNDGQGNFSKENWHVLPSESTTTIVAADFNGDGFIDLAVPHRDGGVSRVLFNDAKMSFSNTTTFGAAVSSTRACATGDLNGDGAMDLIVGDDHLGTMVCLNNGKGIFPTSIAVGDPRLVAYAIAVGDGKGSVYGIAIGDINADSKNDIVQARSNATNSVFLNRAPNS